MTEYLQHTYDLNTPEIAGAFDESSLWGSRFGDLLLSHIEFRPGIAILDVGCATGFPTFELAQTFGRSCRVVGVDIWQEALQRARFKWRVNRVPNVAFLAADAAKLPFPAEAFDLIVSNLGLNNFADPAAMLEECFRVARPGGRVAFTTNVTGHMAEFYQVYRDILAEFGKPAYLERLAAGEAHRGSPESVRRLLEAAGFRVVKQVEDRFMLRYANANTLFEHWLTQLGFLEGWRRVVGPADEDAVFEALETRLDCLAARDGELRLTVPMLYIEGEKPA
ncbi:MAG: class I SAM-dependent methyltransferase [Chloroflexia bacterium]